jgi:hypothetical protein
MQITCTWDNGDVRHIINTTSVSADEACGPYILIRPGAKTAGGGGASEGAVKLLITEHTFIHGKIKLI